MGFLYISGLTGSILYKRYRVSMTKHRQQSTKVRVKNSVMESGLFFPMPEAHSNTYFIELLAD